jgi:RNA polymerase II-associated protein 3
MPAKYSHVKKRPAQVRGSLQPQQPQQPQQQHHQHRDTHRNHQDPLVDQGISQAMSIVSDLERCIARMLLLRFEQDIARLFSTRLHNVSLKHLPSLVLRCIAHTGPGWVAFNVDCEDIKDFFRAAISMDLRQTGERIATKSVLWTYTVLRDFVRPPIHTLLPSR